MDKETAVILTKTKSTATAVILTLFFGGLGLFYASIVGGIVMTILEILCIVVGVFTFGLGFLLIPVIHIVTLIWAVVAVKKHNSRLVQMATR
jgi:hypothetical protein